MPPPPVFVPTPLFPAFPPTTLLPIYWWRAWLNPSQSIVSTVAAPRPLSDIPAGIVAMEWGHDYAAPPAGQPLHLTLDYGDSRPYIFKMPDGSTRTTSANMSAQAYSQFVTKMWSEVGFPQ